MNGEQRPESATVCTCPCHKSRAKVVCCLCFVNGVPSCECGKKRYCCGEREPSRTPEAPRAPGWRLGDNLPADPFAGATDDSSRRARFPSIVLDLVQSASGGKGP